MIVMMMMVVVVVVDFDGKSFEIMLMVGNGKEIAKCCLLRRIKKLVASSAKMPDVSLAECANRLAPRLIMKAAHASIVRLASQLRFWGVASDSG